MSKLLYKCSRCNWIGEPGMVDHEDIETCFGKESLEVCPDCGNSVLIFHQLKKSEKQTEERV